MLSISVLGTNAEQLELVKDQFHIKLQNRSFTPTSGLEIASIVEKRAPDEQVHFFLQFKSLPNATERDQFEKQGIKILDYVTGNTYIASTKVVDLSKLKEIQKVRWAGPFKADDKISTALKTGEIGKWALVDGGIVLTIQFNKDIDTEKATKFVKSLNAKIISVIPIIPSVTAIFDAEKVKEISQEDAVQFVDVVGPPLEELNDGARAAANINPLSSPPYGLTGAGITVLVYDVGTVAAHQDFGTRIIQTDASSGNQIHSTHVAGTVGGSGVNSNGIDNNGNPNGGTANQWAGMAPAVNIRSFGISGSTDLLYDSGGDLNTDFTTSINNGIDLATMSLGNNVVPNGFPCGQLGDYTNTAILIDNIVRGSIANQNLIYFEAAGNERQRGAPCSNFGTIGSPATAKNSIAVGAINSNDNSITGFTSFGPTDDGRLKPDIVAPGCQSNGDLTITSTGLTNNYVGLCGTSMATPVASGTTALLIQQWQAISGSGTRPLPHTVKAILVHTANDLGNAGPDYAFGWGALNGQAAIDLVRANENKALINVNQVDVGVTDSYPFHSDGSSNVRVTLAWDDPPATRLATATLINNLDLRLQAPDGTIYTPFVLNPTIPNNPATRGNDVTNNVEMVVGNAMAGIWTATVAGATVPQGPQQYTIVIPDGPTRPHLIKTCLTNHRFCELPDLLTINKLREKIPIKLCDLIPCLPKPCLTCPPFITKEILFDIQQEFPPLKQVQAGIDLKDIVAAKGQVLIINDHRVSPASVTQKTAKILISRSDANWRYVR